ncbi:unnamed protein product [Cylindrotheca closterium]|uniref:G-protein coupled receptors family 2 profile 2 domain-containing protein n=1 Tax=Cylindrotheca closterium TaxID=2856 RepID=A0AAD2FR59_9STRA|nr:unnamed protein product [Cylindrotheca closterium]
MAEPSSTYLYVPSEDEQKAISILLVLSASLSLVGSSCIVYHVRHNSKSTPYRRIMLGMSACDIVSTIGYALQPYVGLKGESNSFVWSFGNAASCSFIGALAQFGFSAHLYSAALSYYFLSTIRYGTREAVFAKKYERWIHVAIILWSVATAIVGIALDIFHLNDLGPGCWVSGTPDCTGVRCWAELIAWVMGGIPTLLSFFSILINNLKLYCFVRQTVREGQRRALEKESQMISYRLNNHQQVQDNVPMDTSNHNKETRSMKRQSSVLTSSEKQWKRVREVGRQSFLYVGAYLLSFLWTIIKQALDGQDFERSPGSGTFLLPLSILQAIFLPAQGLLNALIFFRPKYKQARKLYGEQPRLWLARRAVLGGNLRSMETNTLDPMSRRTTGGSRAPVSQRSVSASVVVGQKRVNFAGEVVSRCSNPMLDVPQNEALPAEGEHQSTPSEHG